MHPGSHEIQFMISIYFVSFSAPPPPSFTFFLSASVSFSPNPNPFPNPLFLFFLVPASPNCSFHCGKGNAVKLDQMVRPEKREAG